MTDMNGPDLVVVGGGLAGCFAAVEASDRGLKVVVVEKRSYLGREITAYNHTFIRCAENDDALRRCPAPFRTLFQLTAAGEIVAPEGETRKHLLTLLEERNITVLFEAEPVAASLSEGHVTGLLLACPVGLAWLPCGSVLDTGERGNLLRLLKGEPYLEPGALPSHAAFEMIFPSTPTSLLTTSPNSLLREAESALGLDAESLHLHPSLRSDTLVLDFAFQFQAKAEPCVSRSRLESAGRSHSVELATWLRKHAPEFQSASLSHLAYECHVDSGEQATPPSPYENLAVAPVLPWGFSLEAVADLSKKLQQILNNLNPVSGPNAISAGHVQAGALKVPMKELDLSPLNDDGLAVALYTTPWVEALEPKVVFDSDVCVAGAGAGGGMAMVAAAKEGCRVTVVDVNRELGGTYTIGRVCGYYDGYRGGINKSFGEDAKQGIAGAASNPGVGGLSHSELLRRSADSANVLLLTGSRTCGVRCSNGVVTRILAANEEGLFAINAHVTIDATGDADVAAAAGVPYDMGDPRDGMVQSYSMWGAEVYSSSSFLSERYLTDPGVFHPDCYSERLRAISLGHRNNSPFRMSPMLTPRESRRIVGEAALTVEDILEPRVVPDAIAVACTRADSHAYTSSDLARLGSLGNGKLMQVRIPYGCYIPKGFNGLLMAAKALSGERDATGFCRMNADIKNAGFALGLAAAMAAKDKVGVREINLTALQEKLKQSGCLPEWTFQNAPKESLADSVDALLKGDASRLDTLMRLPAAQVIPALEAAFDKTQKVNTSRTEDFQSVPALLCLGLAWHGSSVGGNLLLDLFNRAIAEGRHLTPPRIKAYRTGIIAGGWGQDDYTLVNRLLIMAGRSGADLFHATITRIAEDTPGLGKRLEKVMPYDLNRLDIVADPFYTRIQNLALAAEWKAHPSLAPALETLLNHPGVCGYSVPIGSLEKPQYMRTHLELGLARAATRCGSRLGTSRLIQFLDDTHVFFRRHARQELIRMAGSDQGNISAWENWLEALPR